MRAPVELPGWLDACRPDDALYADAYESTSAQRRALLKTTIAFAFHRWRDTEGFSRTERASVRSGFRHVEARRPADWVLAVLGPGFASPARLLSALLPAVIADVGRIILISEEAFSPAVCTALELAGLEDSFLLNVGQSTVLFEELIKLSPEGRLLTFPSWQGTLTDEQNALLHRASAMGLPFLHDLPAPRILSLHKPDSETDAALRWLYPDADILHQPAPGIRAAFAPEGALIESIAAEFLAGPGMEACWPGPSPEFYLTQTCSAFLFQENTLEDIS